MDMAGAPPPPSSRSGGGMSLYANLLDTPADTSISRAPIVSREALDAVKEQQEAKKALDPALRFQPVQTIRRPQPKIQKAKTAVFPKAPGPPPVAATVAPAGHASPATATTNEAGDGSGRGATAPAKSTLADWATADDDKWGYSVGEKRARGGRKKKKNKGKDVAPVETDWDETYDPSKPTNVDEYMRSDERIREIREWKALLYRHRRPEKRKSSWDSDEDEDRPAMNSQFAPPSSYSFAPPPLSPPRASLADDETGDYAYVRRLALSQGQIPPPPKSPSPPLPPPPTQSAPEPDSSTISRAPVRYAPTELVSEASPPHPPIEAAAMDEDVLPDSETSAERSNRPGQKGFAARLMSKYGWSKGQGLGVEGSGIVAPLRVAVEKRKKRPDSEGGGWAEPGAKGRIIAPKVQRPTSTASESSKFGVMSNVIVMRNMLHGMDDLQHEMENGLGQEIGEECGDRYGRVERLYIDLDGKTVFIKFVDQVSALRAVNALDGRVFNGNTIEPRYYDVDNFEKGIYDG